MIMINWDNKIVAWIVLIVLIFLVFKFGPDVMEGAPRFLGESR